MRMPRSLVRIAVVCSCVVLAWQTERICRVNAAEAAPQQQNGFRLEALVDFPDDALASPVPVSPEHIDAMMLRLKELGVRRVTWAYYGDGHGGYAVPTECSDERWKNLELTYQLLGNPLKVAVEAGHRHGLEVFAYFKPYETGPAVVIPEGSPEAKQNGRIPHQGGSLGWADPFVISHPELRIQHRAKGLIDDAARPSICSIRLTKRDAAPTRITKEHLQIWTSPNNYRYERAEVAPKFSDAVKKSSREVRDQNGAILTRKGDPVRVLTLSGLNLRDKYILVTTDFGDGPGDFSNAGTSLLTALDKRGHEIPCVFASGGTVWLSNMIDFRNGGLVFDHGFGDSSITLDEPNTNRQKGFVAFAAGRNKYLPGALCETEPMVQEFWLSCLDEMIAAGVDGVDFREENHSTHTDFPKEYGFNPVVLERCRGLEGKLEENIARVRGEAYTDFLRKCKERLSANGKLMRYNLQLDYLRPDPPACRLLAYPANLHFDWQRWLKEGLVDEVNIRFYQLPFNAVFDDKIAQEIVTACHHREIPMCVNRYLHHDANTTLPAEIQRVKQDGRFAGFIFYETASYLKFDALGGCTLTHAGVQAAADRARE